MAHRLTVVDLPLRLIGSGGDVPCYRPLAIGRAVLNGPSAGGPWWVQVSLDGTLRPIGPRVSMATSGRCRTAVALISPEDLPGRLRSRVGERSKRRDALSRLTGAGIYGWCLMYQPAGIHGIAIIDSHESLVELPAYFELPLELLDRAEFLASRGIRSRPLALLAQPGDFETPPDGGSPRNRFLQEIRLDGPGNAGSR